MGEEASNIGDRANKRLVALLEGLGWNARGIPDVGISCEKSDHDSETHGVDGYLTYYDPYYNSRRGILIESKSKNWQSWSGVEMNDAAQQARETLECSILSDDFKSKYQVLSLNTDNLANIQHGSRDSRESNVVRDAPKEGVW